MIHHIWRYGGDPANIHLCGQSAGGHLAAVALLSQVVHGVTQGDVVQNLLPVVQLFMKFYILVQVIHNPMFICYTLQSLCDVGSQADGVLLQVEKSQTGNCKLAIGYDWDPLCLQSFIGVSGAYCLETLSEHLHSRGLYKRCRVYYVV